ncbi:MAG: hypothetical protein M3447_11510 [Acidobacteriota bacterium]|nr:hypothetical protein [Acidobacteriota bacterium]
MDKMNTMNTMNTQFRSKKSEWAKTISLIVALLAVTIVIVGLSGCSAASKQDAAANEGAAQRTAGDRQGAVANSSAPPKSLAKAGEYAENVYDMAKANDWTNAAAKLGLLKESTTMLSSEVKGRARLDRLASGVTTLDKAVAAKNRETAMREANQMTLIVANLTAVYQLAVPIEVTKLDYYGRELEIWSTAKDTKKLQATVVEMRRTWDAVRPAIVSHKGSAEAKKFDELVAKVEKAKTPDQYAQLATPVLNEVDNLEKVFHG